MMKPARWKAWIGLLMVLGCVDVFAATSTDRDMHAELDAVNKNINQIMDQAVASGDMQSAASKATKLFMQVAVWADTSDSETFVASAYAYRLLACLNQAKDVDHKELLSYLRENPDFGKALCFQINSRDDPSKVMALASRLIKERSDRLNTYASLAAALCLVFDEPLERNINENHVKAEDPISLFDYYTAHEKSMSFGIREVPTELLIYVVDSTATIPEMNWALNKYAGDKAVGKCFFSIRYDTSHFSRGTEKQVTSAGYNLPNILKFGGVCADQAYFAVSVGKAIGVPTAYTRGQNAEVSHAWVGYLQRVGNKAVWNFDEGRYKVYQGVRGVVEDPQTRVFIPDSFVSILGEMIGCNTSDRYTATAMVDAACFLQALASHQEQLNPSYFMDTSASIKPRGTDPATRLTLLEAALRHNPGCVYGWQVLANMAASGELTLEDKKRWSDVSLSLCGDKYPDFSLAILGPMIQTIDDPNEQNHIWESAAKLFTSRKDLSAEILMSQGNMWAKQGDSRRAGRCYEEVVNRYVNDGPFVLRALDEIEKILCDMNQPEKILQVYDQTWASVGAPGRMASEFYVQSNWYKIGKRYAERLRKFGFNERADKVDTAIKRAIEG